MPDTKFNWANLKEHLRKFAVIYIVLIVLSVFGTDLLWTTTTPRVPGEQQVLFYLADGWVNSENMAPIAADILARLQPEDPTLLEVSFENLMFTDTDYTGAMVMMARLAAGEGDVFLAGPGAMDNLVRSGACLPLDEYYENGWMKDSGLEPFYATVADDETGEETTFLAGFRLDSLHALMDGMVMNNEGAFLCIPVNSGNLETSMRAAEMMVEDLQNGGLPHA